MPAALMLCTVRDLGLAIHEVVVEHGGPVIGRMLIGCARDVTAGDTAGSSCPAATSTTAAVEDGGLSRRDIAQLIDCFHDDLIGIVWLDCVLHRRHAGDSVLCGDGDFFVMDAMLMLTVGP